MSRAVLSLGSNLGDREKNIRGAIRSLSLLPHTNCLKISDIYETEPVGFADQPLFLNAAAIIETQLTPHALLGACLGIEAALGRVRKFQNGPRVIDIDLLVYENITLNHSELTLPHPRMGERGFVLVPLADLFPDGNVLGFDFSRAIQRKKHDGVRKYKIPSP
ncbi:MAG TPA: 2-amino-4-hydroxy-6-hydroxymethyldihydropteridine diphosphokinase [Ruminococcaceae bacterium]|nr:2-amino-4-hydroxy-6-hydroxymethyldihydropteridine diphosphokinase [Oscillospiraceae bacterium]